MDKTLSLTFNVLRLPLALLVVYLHIDHIPLQQIFESGFNTTYTAFDLIKVAVVLLARVAVPAFFLISGYLLFYKHNSFFWEDYLMVIQKKIKTLVVPYIIWNLLAVGYLYSTQGIVFHSFDSIFCAPANFPLWFLRNLIILFFLYPIILFFIKLKLVGFTLLLSFYLVCGFSIGIHPYTYNSIFFFSLGGFWAIYGNLFFRTYLYGKRHYIYIMALVSYVLAFVYYGRTISIFENVYVVFSVFAIFLLSYNIMKTRNISFPFFLANSSFFIYVSHKLGFTALSKYTLFFIPNTEMGSLLKFLICPIITVIYCILVYSVLLKLKSRYNFINILIGK